MGMCLLLFCRVSVIREHGLFLKVIRQTRFVMNGTEQRGMQAGARSWRGKKKRAQGQGDRNLGPTGVSAPLIPAFIEPTHRGCEAANSRAEGETPAGQGLLSARVHLLYTLTAPACCD